MKAEPIIIERVLDAPLARVWKAITDKDDMKQWYFALSDFKAEPGFQFSFEGGDDKKTYVHRCRITEVIPNKKLSYTWAYDNFPGIETLVSFELFEEEGNKTRVRLTHSGVGQFPSAEDPNFAKESFTAGWTEIIGSMLKKFVEK